MLCFSPKCRPESSPKDLSLYALPLNVSPRLLVPTKALHLDRTVEDPGSSSHESPALNGLRFTKQDSFPGLLPLPSPLDEHSPACRQTQCFS